MLSLDLSRPSRKFTKDNDEGAKDPYSDYSHVADVSSYGQVYILLQPNAVRKHRIEMHADTELQMRIEELHLLSRLLSVPQLVVGRVLQLCW